MPRNEHIRIRLSRDEKGKLAKLKGIFRFGSISELARFLMFSNDLPEILSSRLEKNRKFMKSVKATIE